MPQYVKVKNTTTNSVSTMDSNIAEDWVRRHDEDPKTKGMYVILAPVKVNVSKSEPEKKKDVAPK